VLGPQAFPPARREEPTPFPNTFCSLRMLHSTTVQMRWWLPRNPWAWEIMNLICLEPFWVIADLRLAF